MIFWEWADSPSHAKRLTWQHLRMQSRSEFNLWREALGPIIAYTHSFAKIPAESKPSAVHAAQ